MKKPQKQDRGAATVEKVLTAALACFIAGDDSIHAIAKRSETSIGSLYHHFGSRERVMLALYRCCLGELLEQITAQVRTQPSAEAGVRSAVEAYLRFVEEHPKKARLIFSAAHLGLDREFRDEVIEHAALITAPMREWFGGHMAHGRLRAVDPALFEILLIGGAAEAARRILAKAPGLTFDAARRELAEAAWAALQPQVDRPRSRT